MNMATKIFVILNLLLAAGAAATTATWYATHEHWKRRWDIDTQNIGRVSKQLESTVKKVSTELQIAQDTVASTKEREETLRTENEQLKSQLQASKGEMANLQADYTRASERITALESSLSSKENTLEGVRNRNNELNHIANVSRAVAFSLNVKLSELEDDLSQASMKIAKREEELNLLQEDMKSKAATLAWIKDHYPRVYSNAAEEGTSVDQVITAVVAAVRENPQGQQNLVMLSVGADDKVAEGMQFVIYRDSQYIAKVRVEKVFPDMAACSVITQSWNTNGTRIKQGDSATNRLF